MEVGPRSGSSSSRPQRSTISKAAKDARSWLRDYITAIKNGRIHPFSPPERVTRAATRNEPWGPTGEQLRMVTALCDSDEASRAIVFAVLETRLRVQTPTKWRNPFKALSTVEFLLKRADESTVAELVSDDRKSLKRLASASSSRSSSHRNLGAVGSGSGAASGGAVGVAGAAAAAAVARRPEVGRSGASVTRPSGQWLTASDQAMSQPALTRAGSFSSQSFARGQAAGVALDGALPSGAPPSLPRNAIAFLAAALAAPGGAMHFNHADNPSSAPGSIAREAAVVMTLLSDPDALAAAREDSARLRERDRSQATVARDGWGSEGDAWTWVAQQQRQGVAAVEDGADASSLGRGSRSVSTRSSPSRAGPLPPASVSASSASVAHAAGGSSAEAPGGWAASPMDPTTPLDDGGPSPAGARVTSSGVYGATSFRAGSADGQALGPQTSQVDLSPAAATARRLAALETLAADNVTGGGCADCGDAVWAKPGPYPVVFVGLPPAWASPSAGVFLCNACAIAHRAAGAGEVRPVSMPDMWTAAEVARIARAGNTRANGHWLGAVGGVASGIAGGERPTDPTARLEHVRRKYLDLRWAEGAWPPPDVPPYGSIGRRILEDLREDLRAEGVLLPGITAPEAQTPSPAPRAALSPGPTPRVDWASVSGPQASWSAQPQGASLVSQAGWAAQQQATAPAVNSQPSWPVQQQQAGAANACSAAAVGSQPSWPSQRQQAGLPTSPAPSLGTDLRRLEDFASALERESGLVSAAREAGDVGELADMTRLEGSMASGSGAGLDGPGEAPLDTSAALIEGLSSLGVVPKNDGIALQRDADIVSASDLSESQPAASSGSGSASGSPRRAPPVGALQTIAEESSGRLAEGSMPSDRSTDATKDHGLAALASQAPQAAAATTALPSPAATAQTSSPWPSGAPASSPWPSGAAASSPWPSGAAASSPWPSGAAADQSSSPWPSAAAGNEGSGLAALEAAGAGGLAPSSLLLPGQSRGASYASPEPPSLPAPSLPMDMQSTLHGTPSPEDASVSSESSPPPKPSVGRKGSSAAKLAGKKQARFLSLRELAAVRASADI